MCAGWPADGTAVSRTDRVLISELAETSDGVPINDYADVSADLMSKPSCMAN